MSIHCLCEQLYCDTNYDKTDTMEEPSRNAYQAIHFAVDARYRLVKRLGQGTYGTVCSAQDLKSEDQHLIAVKKVNNIFNREVLVRRALRELRLMRCLRGHRNVRFLPRCDTLHGNPD